jgi:hypothetical protein
MLQIIHDIAPQALLYFSKPGTTTNDYVTAIQNLASAGCNIIVDDIFFLNEPMFMDGFIAQKVDEVVANGVTYVSAAGNWGKKSYEASGFVSSGITRDADPSPSITRNVLLHDFDPSAGVDAYQSITIPTGTKAHIILQWQEPFRSVASGSGGAQTDFDLLIYDSTGTNLQLSRINMNVWSSGGTGDPIEQFIELENSGSTVDFTFAIGRYQGSGGGKLKIVEINIGNTAGITFGEYATNSGTAYGHTNAAGAISVGAAPYGQTPEYGTSPAQLPSPNWSSAGGVPILFNTLGQAISPVVRETPDIVAPTGVNTTLNLHPNNENTDTDSDGYPNFSGTSSSAPHIAALAALLRDARDEYSILTPAQIRTAMTSTASNMQAAGYDYESGYGFVDANAALLSVDGSTTRTVTYNGGATNETFWLRTVGNYIALGPTEGVTLFTFPASKVSQVTFNGDAGEDYFVLTPSTTVTFPIAVNGGNNDDTLSLNDPEYVFSTNFLFDGGAGNDIFNFPDPTGVDFYRQSYDSGTAISKIQHATSQAYLEAGTFDREYKYYSVYWTHLSGNTGSDRIDLYGTSGVVDAYVLGNTSIAGYSSVTRASQLFSTTNFEDIRAISNLTVGGNDTLTITGSTSADTFNAYKDHGDMTGGANFIYSGIKSVTAHGNGGTDVTNFYPTTDNDKLEGNVDGLSSPTSVTGAVGFYFGNTNSATFSDNSTFVSSAVSRGFTTVYANAYTGSAPDDYDRAYLHGTTGNDYVDTENQGTWNRRTYISDANGNQVNVRNFGFVDSYAYTGYDTASLDDTANDWDYLEAFSSTGKIYMNSQATKYFNWLTGFDMVSVYTTGYDSGKNDRKNTGLSWINIVTPSHWDIV